MNLNQIMWLCDNSNSFMKNAMNILFVVSFILFAYGLWRVCDCCINNKKTKKNKKKIKSGLMCIGISLILLIVFLLNISIFSC